MLIFCTVDKIFAIFSLEPRQQYFITPGTLNLNTLYGFIRTFVANQHFLSVKQGLGDSGDVC